MTTYNMGFRINDILLEIVFVKELILAGYHPKRISKTSYSVEGLTEEWVDRIRKVADKYWYY
jgi:hypothetical protein